MDLLRSEADTNRRVVIHRSRESGQGYLSTGAELELSHLRFFGFIGLSAIKTVFETSMEANPVLSKHPCSCGGGRGMPTVLATTRLRGKKN